ncbi:MAG TPA: 3-isopropylmalate dehydratase small subunit [Thermosynergistes sp.]|nr:3-isopropylmalate dehydratase small subunit [Thermosynergistes sp.]HOK19660.1 3-isopropylmalate dehydratase small subunit [Thermosynergistes sp.]HPZ76100.1 3-isopropylmalate dehydratase small subunit [Thermosynergistes sp.]
MSEKLRGRAWVYGNDVDTDVIIPARYLVTSDPEELGRHCMEDLDPEFIKKMKPGDVVVGGENFGCGSSREHAPLALKSAGVSCVIAASFARIFFRNAINVGLPIFESSEAVNGISAGDEVEVDPSTGIIRNLSKGETYRATSYPPFLRHLIEVGGLVPYVRERLKEKEV